MSINSLVIYENSQKKLVKQAEIREMEEYNNENKNGHLHKQ